MSPFSLCCFQDLSLLLVFKNLTMMFWDTDLFVFILLIVHELLSCVHYYISSKLGSFLLLFLLFFFPFFPLSCPLGSTTVLMLVSHRSLGLYFFFCPSFHSWLFFFFCWPVLIFIDFFLLPSQICWVPLVKFWVTRYWSFWLQNSPLILFYNVFILSRFCICWLSSRLPLCFKHGFLYFLSIFTIPALKCLSAKSNF